MAYIGNQPFTTAFLTDQFSGNGTTTAFTLSAAPANTNSLLVAVTGVLQDPSTYSVSGTTLTFSAAPPSGTGNISVRFLGIPASGVVTTAYRTLTEFTATAGQTTFTPPSYTVGYINVFRNGVMLGTADYTASNGTTVVLVNPASAGDLIAVESFYVSSVLNAIPATAGSISSTYLAANSVTSSALAASSVTTAAIAAGAVIQADLATGVAGTGPAFSGYTSNAQTFSNSAFTKVQINNEEFDTANCFDPTTNYRFTPNVAGYYQVNAYMEFNSAGSGVAIVSLYKNGSEFKRGGRVGLSVPGGGNVAQPVSALIFLNGSTDYVEFYVFQNSGGGLTNISTNGVVNYFQASLVRAA